MTDAVPGIAVTSANPNNQTNLTLTVNTPAADPTNDTLVVIEISGDASGTGVVPTGMAIAGYSFLGEISDSNAGTASSSSYIGVFWKVIPAGTAAGTAAASWTHAGQMCSIATPYTNFDATTPVVWQAGQEKAATDANYTVSGTTTDTGLLATAYGCRTSTPNFSAMPDNARALASVATSGCMLAGRVTATSVASGTAYTKTATGSSTSVGTAVAYVIRGASSSSAASGSASFAFTASGAAAGPGSTGTASFTLAATGSAPSGAASGAVGLSFTANATGLTPAQLWVKNRAGGTQVAGHRDGTWGTYGEETLPGYQALASYLSYAALEISVWDTSDGVYVCSHDSTTGRVFSGTNYTINSTTWATLSPNGASTVGRPTTIVGGNPLMRLEEILDAFPTRIFVVENKHGTNESTLATLLDAHALGRWIFKGPYNDTSNANIAAGHGAPMWLYFYPSQVQAGNLPTTYAAVSSSGVPIIFGLGDYSTAPVPVQSDADTFFAFTKPRGIYAWAHILGTSTQKSTADGQAASDATAFDGYMMSNVPALVAGDSTASATGTVGFNFTAGGTAAAPVAGSVALNLTTAGNTAGSATGTATFALTTGGTPSPAAASGTVGINLTTSAAAAASPTGTASFSLNVAGAAPAAPAAGTAAFTFVTSGNTGGSSPASGSVAMTLTAAGSASARASAAVSFNFTASGVGQSPAAGTIQAQLTASGSVSPVLAAAGTVTLAMTTTAQGGGGTARDVILIGYIEPDHWLGQLEPDRWHGELEPL